jgi:adenosine deaminase
MGNKSSHEAQSVEELRQAYDSVISSAQLPDYDGRDEVPPTFFQAYYSGCGVLQTRQDFFDLAFDYFQRAAKMNVRYCEVFFDPQSHTARGVEWEDLMGGLRDAQQRAAAELNVCSHRSNCVHNLMTDTSCRSSQAGSCASFATRLLKRPYSTIMPPHHIET